MSFLILCGCLILVLLILYKRTYSYWSSRDVKGPFPFPFIGTVPWLLKDGIQAGDQKLFKTYGKIYGEYMGTTPNLVISDIKLAQQILVTDFNVFRQTQKFVLPKIFANVVAFISVDKWKHLRLSISPAFSTVKLRRSVEHLKKPMQTFVQNLNELITEKKDDQICVKELTKAYTLDSIAKYVFSVEIDSFKQRADVFVLSMWRLIRLNPTPLLLTLLLPTWISRWLGGWIAHTKSANYFDILTRNIIKKRRENPNIKYNDFLDFLLENDSLTDDEIVSHCLVFFLGGMDTVSNALCVVLSDLAIHPHIQERLLVELHEKLDDGHLTYDKINELEYLNGCLMESLRITPIVNRLVRYPQTDYKLPGTNIVIGPESAVLINAYNIHFDEEIYPQPYEYRPERFIGEEKQKLPNHSWLPFSDGPRNCVGVRMALTEMKFFLANIVRDYKIQLSKECRTPIIYDRGIFLIIPKDLKMKFVPRNM